MASTEQARLKYDQLADHYEDLFFYVVDVGQRLVDYAAPAPGTRLLDIGAGRGAVARAGLARGCAVTAIDASPRMIERLRADFPEIDGAAMDANHLDFADGSFDVVTAGFVVQVLDHPATVLAEIRRVLVPGGMVALSLEKQAFGRFAWFHDLSTEFFSPAAGAPQEQPGPLTDRVLDDLLAEAGFVDLTREPVEMPLALADPQALWDWLARQGLPDALAALPAARAAQFRERLYAGAEHMHTHGGIAIEFHATLHRAHSPG